MPISWFSGPSCCSAQSLARHQPAHSEGQARSPPKTTPAGRPGSRASTGEGRETGPSSKKKDHENHKNTLNSQLSTEKGLKFRPEFSKNTQPSEAPALDNQPSALTPTWHGVFFEGPEPVPDRQDGDEIPTWTVYVGDDEAEPTGTVYTCFSFSFALDLAQRMARDRRLELIQDAIAA